MINHYLALCNIILDDNIQFNIILYISLTTLDSYDETLLYTDGNQIDLDLLISVFPF